MAILVNANTLLICLGFTGAQGMFHYEQAVAYRTKMACGVTRGIGRKGHSTSPVLNTVVELLK